MTSAHEDFAALADVAELLRRAMIASSEGNFARVAKLYPHDLREAVRELLIADEDELKWGAENTSRVPVDDRP